MDYGSFRDCVANTWLHVLENVGMNPHQEQKDSNY